MTINQAIGKLKRLDNLLSKEANKILFSPTRGLEGIMKERIFLEGLNSDTNPIGVGYSKRWGKARTKKGLQTDFVDLKFSGRLRKSMTTKRADANTSVIVIDNDTDYEDKAVKQEDLRGFYIFRPTDDEVDILEVFVGKALDIQIDKILA
jgi:hypothetical protein